MNVRLTSAAEDDVTHGYAWYEERKDGLGLEFIERVEQAIGKIVKSLLGHKRVIRDARKCELEQFPYALWYIAESEEDSIVIGCLHGKRDRVLAKERALGVIEMPRQKP
ncbi:MAG TPA: hypothetical protein VGG97_17715 [Bryobacteraceae bacterium]